MFLGFWKSSKFSIDFENLMRFYWIFQNLSNLNYQNFQKFMSFYWIFQIHYRNLKKSMSFYQNFQKSEFLSNFSNNLWVCIKFFKKNLWAFTISDFSKYLSFYRFFFKILIMLISFLYLSKMNYRIFKIYYGIFCAFFFN